MLKIAAPQAKSFRTDENGAVAMTFALVLSALLFLAGMGLDYSRAMNVRSRIADAADSAVLAAGRALMDGKLSDGEIRQLAVSYFNQNVKSIAGSAQIETPSVTVDATTGSVNFDVNAHVSMTLARLGGFKQLDVPVSTAAVFQAKDIEVGMALDITGSMSSTINGTRKIDALKSAFETFADKMLSSSSDTHKVRIGVAPYSASVNLGTFAAAASNNRSTDGCVNERRGGAANDDTSDPFFVKLDGVNGNYYCPGSKIMPLSNDENALVRYVKTFSPSGSTAGHLGTQWAWNLVSDNWGGVWGGSSVPASYDLVTKGRLLKAVVLMTDGEFNTEYHYGKSAKQAVALCTAMKDKGITVFTVGFGLGSDPTAIDTLRTCASGKDYFADARNPEELDAAFAKFASKLTELRLAK